VCGVEIIGGTATWQRLDAAPTVTFIADQDYMACKFSPSYMGDRGLALVGAPAAAGVNFLILSQPGVAAQAIIRNVAVPGVTSLDYDAYAAGVAVNSLIAADIAMPTDFDPSLTSGQVSYMSLATTAAAFGVGVANRGGAVAMTDGVLSDDVYRITVLRR
jgi:hypothetical protein